MGEIGSKGQRSLMGLGIGRVALIAIIAALVVVGVALIFLLQTFRNPVLGTWVCGQIVIGSVANFTATLTFDNGGKVTMSAEANLLGSRITVSGEGNYSVSGNNVTITIPIQFGGSKAELRYRGWVEDNKLILRDSFSTIECYRR